MSPVTLRPQEIDALLQVIKKLQQTEPVAFQALCKKCRFSKTLPADAITILNLQGLCDSHGNVAMNVYGIIYAHVRRDESGNFVLTESST